MPVTRRQTAIQEGKIKEAGSKPKRPKRARKSTKALKKRDRDAVEAGLNQKTEEPPLKKHKTKGDAEGNFPKKWPIPKPDEISTALTPDESKIDESFETPEEKGKGKQTYMSGTIERGHIYFLYRPKVELEEAQSLDDVKNFHILLIPRPPEFSTTNSARDGHANKADPSRSEDAEMKVIAPGADAVPVPVTRRTSNQRYRLISVGKKRLPDPQSPGVRGGKEAFWALVTGVGDNLRDLVEGFGAKTYETKTRGTRHEEPVRLVARGGYALVNTEPRVPSQKETHLGYHVSHPRPSYMGDVQDTLGIYSSSSFVIQVKNPLAPISGPQPFHAKAAEYPKRIMEDVFGIAGSRNGHSKGRESYGLRFASCETPELLDYVGAQLLLIAAREGEEGLEVSLGDSRGDALKEAEDKEGEIAISDVLKEIGLDSNMFTSESLEGHWA